MGIGVQGRIDFVRGVVEALNRGDVEALLAHAAPEFEYDLSRTISPLRGVHPRVRMRKVIADFLGDWESVRYEPEEVIAKGDYVVMHFTTRFRGRDGLELESRASWVWTFRDDMVTRLALFQDREEALAAAEVAQ